MLKIRTLLAATTVTAAITPVAAGSAEAGTRTQMVRAVNYVRGWSQRHSLRSSPRLSRAATRWARQLMRRGVLAHASSSSGEIIAWHTGTSPRVNRTVMSWWRSDGHRRVMLGRRYERIGAGRAVGYFNGRRSTIWVVRFAG